MKKKTNLDLRDLEKEHESSGQQPSPADQTYPETEFTTSVPGRRGRDLKTLAEQIDRYDAVHKADLRCGDWVLVTTRNSVYSICALGNDLYSVSGGWFDREGVSPQKIAINGCTWGGSAIKIDIVAAPGLFLEFSNTVMTTRIQDVRVIRAEDQLSV